MIGFVIVSHSHQVADGLKRMADEMTREPVPVVAAGGLEGPEDVLGTDALRIQQAILEVLSADGVLVFADIGSAKLNAEMAMDLLDEDQRRHVSLCDAPLVEGVLAAVVLAAGGAPVNAVMAEARAAYQPASVDVEPVSRDSPHGDQAMVAEYVIANPLGLHARPAALLVAAMNKRQADVRIRNATRDSAYVNAKSINNLVTLEVLQNHRVVVSADGPDARDVHEDIRALQDEGFGEGAPAPGGPAEARTPAAPEPAPALAPAGPILEGIPVAPGLAAAPARHPRARAPEVRRVKVDDPDAEVRRFDAAVDRARDEVRAVMRASRASLGAYEARIFEAQLLQFEDPELMGTVRAGIRGAADNAEFVWQREVARIVDAYRHLEDPILRARGEDLADVGERVLAALGGPSTEPEAFGEPVILCLDQLRPSDVPALDMTWVRGVCVEGGSKTSHAGILAAGLGVPVVMGLGGGLRGVPDGAEILLDGETGTVNTEPSAADRAEMAARQEAWLVRVERAAAVKHRPAITSDGQRRRVAANMRGPGEVKSILESGAEEVGLFRTEFLYMNRSEAPGEEEQYALYREVVEGLAGRPVVMRTMDIGADKPVPYLDRPAEANPNLGWRGLRYCLDSPDLFQAQLRAMLRASAHGPVRVMYPMVSTLEEVHAARRRVDEAKRSLAADGLAFDGNVEIGIMIEVPAAAEMADQLAPHVDFFSIGTNDLTQYVMASDRANPKVGTLFDPLHPAVLRTIDRTIRAARAGGIWVGMCGEMAGNRLATPILLGLDLDEFSMSAPRVPEFKLDFGRLDTRRCQMLAREVLDLESATAVRQRIEAFLAP